MDAGAAAGGYGEEPLLPDAGRICYTASDRGVYNQPFPGIPMAAAEVTMIPQNWVELTDEGAIKNLQKTLDLLDEDDDVQAVYHNWEES